MSAPRKRHAAQTKGTQAARRTHRGVGEVMIRRLGPEDLLAYRRLRLRGLRESPEAFGSSYREELERPLDSLRPRLEQAPRSWLFGAFVRARLVGTVMLLRDTSRKERHKAAIYGLYVETAFRKNGIARALMLRAMEAARAMRGLRQVRLSVTATNRPALRLYQSLGFETYGREDDALFVNGRFYAEFLLVWRVRRTNAVRAQT